VRVTLFSIYGATGRITAALGAASGRFRSHRFNELIPRRFVREQEIDGYADISGWIIAGSHLDSRQILDPVFDVTGVPALRGEHGFHLSQLGAQYSTGHLVHAIVSPTNPDMAAEPNCALVGGRSRPRSWNRTALS